LVGQGWFVALSYVQIAFGILRSSGVSDWFPAIFEKAATLVFIHFSSNTWSWTSHLFQQSGWLHLSALQPDRGNRAIADPKSFKNLFSC